MIIPPGMSWWQALQAGYVEPKNSDGYLSWLHELPCVVSGSRDITVHHVVGHGLKPLGGKTSDFLAIPLARTLHQDSAEALHVMGHKAWEARYGSQLEFSLRSLLQAIHEGRLVWKS